ncbi:TetR/AcrR family transcriptional regulator, partial [Streptomyces sp. NPDC127044]
QPPQFSPTCDTAADPWEARGGDTVEEMRERDFTFALATLIAGIETMVARG